MNSHNYPMSYEYKTDLMTMEQTVIDNNKYPMTRGRSLSDLSRNYASKHDPWEPRSHAELKSLGRYKEFLKTWIIKRISRSINQ